MSIIVALCAGINFGFLILALMIWAYILIKDIKETRKIYKALKEVTDNESRQEKET